MSESPLHSLPPELAERTRFLIDRAPVDGEFVLYWMRGAMRGHENPALDVAADLAARLGLGFFVYQGLSERHPYASDRHHTFILEGAKDVAAELRAREIPYVFHLEREGARGPWLRELGRRAAVVVTEDVPVPPLDAWTRRLAESISAPVLLVDAACVVPMQVAGRAWDRAFAYRKATDAERQARVARPYPEIDAVAAGALPSLPFEPFDVETEDLEAAVSRCAIDHGVAPVPGLRGGSRAGYARWQTFKEHGLRQYARKRNDPLVDGTSRLSPWLHHGMVSPFRIAREAEAEGAEKYLDELLVWRELAWTFCRYRRDLESLSVLPRWAQETLEDHAGDPRRNLFSVETLERSRTGNVLWDAMQSSLRIHGELHNNVRMTWGKALLEWSPDAATTLARLIDLNHRYALDGRDPSSYGGLLWCLGQFDRPFSPAQKVSGTLRARPLSQHGRRLDVKAYARRCERPAIATPPRIAIVGSGVSGLSCARSLQDHGLAATVFERASRPGGRLTTRSTPDGRFDHGAQYFTARDPAFDRALGSWLDDGRVVPWEARVVTLSAGEVSAAPRQRTRYVAVPGMSDLTAHLADGLDVRIETEVQRLDQSGDGWCLIGEAGVEFGPFDVVVLAVPAPGVVRLAPAGSPVSRSAARVTMQPCQAAMLRFVAPFDPGFDAAFVKDCVLSFITRNASKPGRGPEEWWTLHAGPEWSRAAIEEGRSREEVAEALAGELALALGRTLPEFDRAVGHRWGHSLPENVLDERALFDAESGLAACGDWCGGPRVEGAWLSGRALAGRLLGHFARSHGAPSNEVERTGSLFS